MTREDLDLWKEDSRPVRWAAWFRIYVYDNGLSF